MPRVNVPLRLENLEVCVRGFIGSVSQGPVVCMGGVEDLSQNNVCRAFAGTSEARLCHTAEELAP